MDHRIHNQIVNFIWNIADDVLRDVFVRGKYRDIILPFTVIRRLDVLLIPTKEKVRDTYDFLKKNKIDSLDGLTSVSGYSFFNTSIFTTVRKFRTVQIEVNIIYLSYYFPSER